ncbi:hypothetical protein N7450_002113 [Penicillium hetheringtonii]|uniref:Uncharacterized protein n=1 Tax=Penicillium hetheringtonii TaxID=911720 RepID=A0AAD6DVW9_9EURO|nr:hypothetical protein N7450_002113 [Penicillium hetheringtonii]
MTLVCCLATIHSTTAGHSRGQMTSPLTWWRSAFAGSPADRLSSDDRFTLKLRRAADFGVG